MFGLFSKVPTISINQLREKMDKSIILVDVRTPNEYRSGHIVKAKNVPLNKINSYKGDTKEELYVICQSGMRSKKATKILRKNGLNAINVRGGMSQWIGPIKGGK